MKFQGPSSKHKTGAYLHHVRAAVGRISRNKPHDFRRAGWGVSMWVIRYVACKGTDGSESEKAELIQLIYTPVKVWSEYHPLEATRPHRRSLVAVALGVSLDTCTYRAHLHPQLPYDVELLEPRMS